MAPPVPNPAFVLHDHRRPRRHFDLRLEEQGVLRSWAVPRGLPQHPGENRLAVEVADHDLDHLRYEDADKDIADIGWWQEHDRNERRMLFTLHGRTGSNRYALIRTSATGPEQHHWLLRLTLEQSTDVTVATTQQFDGFDPRILDFYEGLEADNSKTYWAAHKPLYDSGISEPMRLLAAALAPEFGEAKVFRPHRDVRFATDKSPYKTSVAMAGAGPGDGALYLEVSARGMFVGGGLYDPSRDQLARFRHLQDEPLIAADLDRAVAAAAAAGYHLGEADALKTAPRGWSSDHPRIGLLRLKRLTVSHRYPPAAWLFTPECVDVVREGWRATQSWNGWLAKHVGPPDVPAVPAGEAAEDGRTTPRGRR